MNNYDKEFLNTFNECYPFERYIIKEPKSIGNLFDDAVLTEIFVPYTEIKPILNDNGRLISFTKINKDEIYVKLRTIAGEIRFGYFDFAEYIRENIRDIFVEDFGKYEYECLYVDHEDEDNSSLIEVLNTQKTLIKEKYGECHIKTSLRDNLMNELKYGLHNSHPMNIYTTYFANIRNLPSDVIPISISLYPPKGYSGLTYPPLFPTPEILKLAKSGNLPPEKYIPLYKHQVLDHLDIRKVILDIRKLSNGKDIALTCYEKPSDFCHRQIISHWMNINGIPVREYQQETSLF